MNLKSNNNKNTEYPYFVKSPKKTRWKIFGIIIATAALMIFYIYNVRSIDELLRQIRYIEEKNKIIKMKNNLLKAKVNELESPDRIIKIANEKLGMTLPDEIPIIITQD